MKEIDGRKIDGNIHYEGVLMADNRDKDKVDKER